MKALLSECGLYRYKLQRGILNPNEDYEPRVLWIMLNPSTANAEVDDPTIRKCMGFSKRLGFNSLWVGNLFGFRATHPKDLFSSSEPVGKDNDHCLQEMIDHCQAVIWAWGSHGTNKRCVSRIEIIKNLDYKNKPVSWVGTTQTGQPTHPLMLAYGQGVQTYLTQVGS